MTIQERRDHPLRRSETSIRGFGWIDYDNDGVKNHVVELGYASGAGRGCDYLYYDEVNAEGTAYVQSERRNQFLDIQLVDLSSRHPNCGGNKNVLLTVNGRAYYEHHTDRSHAVAKIQGGKIVGICRYEKELHTRVRGEILYRRQE